MRIDRDGSILSANPACDRLGFPKCGQGKRIPDRYRKQVLIINTTKPALFTKPMRNPGSTYL
jgi:hypothetical protein